MTIPMPLIQIRLLSVAGINLLSANDINDHGQIVGQFSDAAGAVHGYVYEDGSLCQIDYPRATSTDVLGINNLGEMVGMFSTATATEGFFYNRGTFGELQFPGSGNYNMASSINNRGEIVGVYQLPAPGRHSFLFKGNVYRQITAPGAAETTALGINDSEQIVGEYPLAGATHGFLYAENPGMFIAPIDHPGSTNLVLRAINDGGQIAGGYVDRRNNEHPFIYFGGTLNPVVIPGAVSTTINGINNHGQIVGNVSMRAGGSQPFIAAVPI